MGARMATNPPLAADGNFYGTTYFGGARTGGTIFKITPGGMLLTLHDFCRQRQCTDGKFPVAAPVQATNGDFYGTTEFGGANACLLYTSPSPRDTR